MSPDGSSESSWHAIRPWAPSLSLAVREITSVSATFILSCGETDPSLASVGLEAAEESSETNEEPLTPPKDTVIADALARGLSVNVNGSAWPRAFIRIDDQLDEAVIIIYALMPGRQYDIELGLAPAGQLSTTVRKQVTTEEDSDRDTSEIHTDPDSPSLDNSNSSDTPSTSPSGTAPGTPPVAPQITLEDRLNQLQHTLSAVKSERETLFASLKSARRDSQRADSALRSEIETLKRTSEKNSAAELRGNQKIRALQEAVKRAQNATKETEEEVEEAKRLEPGLNACKEQKEAEYAKIKQEADRVRKEREDIEDKERKRLDSMRAELVTLAAKLEKVNGKCEKLANNVIPDLEEKLKDVEHEIEEELPLHRLHQQMPIGRPLMPIQRPPQADSSPLWSPPRSQSYQNQRRGSLKPSSAQQSTPPATLPSSKSSPKTTSSLTSSPTHPSTANPAPTTTYTLSSRAPAFEPSRSIGAIKNISGNGQGQPPNSYPSSPSPASMPIQRPSALPVGAGRSGSGNSTTTTRRNSLSGQGLWGYAGFDISR